MERHEGTDWVIAILLLVALLAAIAEVSANRGQARREHSLDGAARAAEGFAVLGDEVAHALEAPDRPASRPWPRLPTN